MRDPAEDYDNHDETLRDRIRGLEYQNGGQVGPSTRERSRLLADAAEAINGDRERDYGTAEENFTRIGIIWGALLDRPAIDAETVALMMTGVKMARLVTTPNHRDSWVDGIGYLALGGDIASTEGRFL